MIARLNVGGTAGYITLLANELPKHNIETFVATGFVQGAELEDPSVNSIKVFRIPSLGRSFNPYRDFLARRQLDKLIVELKPDLIHTHTFKAGYVTRIRKPSIPIIHTFHGHLLNDPEFTGFKSKVIIFFEKFLAKRATKLVSVGQNVYKELLEKKIGFEGQYLSIPPGVEPLDVSSRHDALSFFGLTDDDKPIIGWFARVTGVKNPRLALEVARLIPTAQFIIAGGGDLLESVRNEAPSNVKVVGWTKAENILGASDVILLTSKNEGMPVALIEAQLAGKPVVATNVGSVSEVIANNETGLITESDPFALASAINELISNSEKRLAMADFAKVRATDLFSVDRMITSHIAMYKSILR